MIDLNMNNIHLLLKVMFRRWVEGLGRLALCRFGGWRGGGVREFLRLGCMCRGDYLVIGRLCHLL